MGEQGEEHQDADRRGVPPARPTEPAVGEHRRHDTEQLELGVHAPRPTVDQLEGADREQPRRDDAGHAPPAHPPCKERECSHRARDRRHPEPELVDPCSGERQADQVVERRVRVVEPEVVEQVAERPSPGHRGERLVVAEPVGADPPDAEQRAGGDEHDEERVRRTPEQRRDTTRLIAIVCRNPSRRDRRTRVFDSRRRGHAPRRSSNDRESAVRGRAHCLSSPPHRGWTRIEP